MKQEGKRSLAKKNRGREEETVMKKDKLESKTSGVSKMKIAVEKL